jgi:hypothetical protein
MLNGYRFAYGYPKAIAFARHSKFNRYQLPIDMDIHLAIQISKRGIERFASDARNLLARYTANAITMIERSNR